MVDTILYFGSFNPIHKGHLAIVEYLLGHGFCDEIWLVVSPHNPLKERMGLACAEDRLAMARIAVGESEFRDRVKVTDVEFTMPTPSYTIDTLGVLQEQFAGNRFSLLMGSDNVDSLDQWKDYERLMDSYKLMVYPRPGEQITKFKNKITMIENAPMWKYSSTEVREALTNGRECMQMVSRGVLNYIIDNKLWTKEKVYKAK